MYSSKLNRITKHPRRRNAPLAMKSLLLGVLALSLVLPGPSVSGQRRLTLSARGERTGERCTPGTFTLSDVDGKVIRSSELHGRVFILDFWATWCGPCIAEIPMYNRLHEKYGSQGLRIVGVAVQSGWAKDVKPQVAKHQIEYPVLVGNDETVEDFDVVAFPTTLVITQDWKIYKKYVGTTPGKDASLRRDIETLLAH